MLLKPKKFNQKIFDAVKTEMEMEMKLIGFWHSVTTMQRGIRICNKKNIHTEMAQR
jgi:hypothetical protein